MSKLVWNKVSCALWVHLLGGERKISTSHVSFGEKRNGKTDVKTCVEQSVMCFVEQGIMGCVV